MSASFQRGAALVVALMLLVILTLLAVTGMRTAVAELWMAGNEQFHRRAVEAASAGVEVAIGRIGAHGSLASIGPVTMNDSPSDAYSVAMRHSGHEVSLPGSSADKFYGEHYEIESSGSSSRGAIETQVQGVMVISSAPGVETFQQIGEGLAGPGET
ncbi:MAG: PilX N-terminal domain-containing pilus assembly protein [Gammaproteobacteria bacterium]